MEDSQENNLESERQRQLHLRQQVEALERVVRQHLSREAMARYGNLKAAHPDKAMQVLGVLAQAVQSGHIKEQLSDEDLKMVLRRLQEPKKEFRIKRL